MKQGWFAKRRLKRYVNELTSLAKNLSADVKVVNVLIPGYEELDAWIDIVVPDEKEEEISDALSQRRSEISFQNGFTIGLGVMERSHYETVHAKLNGNSKTF